VRAILYVRTIVDEAARPTLDRESARYESVPAYAANFERLGFGAREATIADSARLGEYAGADLDEIVLRAMTPSNSLAELEAFVESTAAWWGR